MLGHWTWFGSAACPGGGGHTGHRTVIPVPLQQRFDPRCYGQSSRLRPPRLGRVDGRVRLVVLPAGPRHPERPVGERLRVPAPPRVPLLRTHGVPHQREHVRLEAVRLRPRIRHEPALVEVFCELHHVVGADAQLRAHALLKLDRVQGDGGELRFGGVEPPRGRAGVTCGAAQGDKHPGAARPGSRQAEQAGREGGEGGGPCWRALRRRRRRWRWGPRRTARRGPRRCRGRRRGRAAGDGAGAGGGASLSWERPGGEEGEKRGGGRAGGRASQEKSARPRGPASWETAMRQCGSLTCCSRCAGGERRRGGRAVESERERRTANSLSKVGRRRERAQRVPPRSGGR